MLICAPRDHNGYNPELFILEDIVLSHVQLWLLTVADGEIKHLFYDQTVHFSFSFHYFLLLQLANFPIMLLLYSIQKN